MTHWQQKTNIRNKHKLKGMNIYVENHPTPEERIIQNEIEIVRLEKEKGTNVKIGYKKIIIEGILYE